MENLYQEELKNGSDQYAVFHSTIYDNPHIDKAEIEQIKKTCDPDTWTVEYMGEYCDNIGQVYWEFDPLEHKHAVDDKEPVLMRVRGLDFGIDDYTACAWVSLLPNNRVYVYDEYQANNLDVPTHAAAIRSKTTIPVQYSILDSACWARDASLTSVAKRFAEQGIGAVQATKDLDGSISDLKRLMANGLVIIDPKCTNLLRAIESWQHGQHEPDILAATRYAIDGLLRSGKLLAPIRNPKEDTRNVIEKVEDKHRRIERLNKALSAKKYNQSFYFHK
jgi:phage terminase large subunit